MTCGACPSSRLGSHLHTPQVPPLLLQWPLEQVVHTLQLGDPVQVPESTTEGKRSIRNKKQVPRFIGALIFHEILPPDCAANWKDFVTSTSYWPGDLANSVTVASPHESSRGKADLQNATDRSHF